MLEEKELGLAVWVRYACNGTRMTRIARMNADVLATLTRVARREKWLAKARRKRWFGLTPGPCFDFAQHRSPQGER